MTCQPELLTGLSGIPMCPEEENEVGLGEHTSVYTTSTR